MKKVPSEDMSESGAKVTRRSMLKGNRNSRSNSPDTCWNGRKY